jgi:hypothetical protein
MELWRLANPFLNGLMDWEEKVVSYFDQHVAITESWNGETFNYRDMDASYTMATASDSVNVITAVTMITNITDHLL